MHPTHHPSAVGLWLVAVIGAGTIMMASVTDEVVATAAAGAALFLVASAALVLALLRG